MKEIKLTQGKVALVDDEDYDWLNQWKWCAAKHSNYIYYAVTWNGSKTVTMHKIIMNSSRYRQTDHIDGNGLNNQRSNLRYANYSQNGSNRRSWGSSRFLGVSIDRGYIRASINVNGKQFFLGMFDTEEDAAVAYDKKAIELHGEFANLNFKS